MHLGYGRGVLETEAPAAREGGVRDSHLRQKPLGFAVVGGSVHGCIPFASSGPSSQVPARPDRAQQAVVGRSGTRGLLLTPLGVTRMVPTTTAMLPDPLACRCARIRQRHQEG